MTSRVAALLMFFMASGVPGWLHHLQHQYEDAVDALLAARASAAAEGGGRSAPHQPEAPGEGHSEANCPLTAQLRAPALAGGWTIHLIATGQCIEWLSLDAISQHAQTVPARISCRGPPALSS